MNRPAHEPQDTPQLAKQLEARWATSTDAWSEQAERIATMTRDATSALLDALGASDSERILDIACGPGDPILSIAEEVGGDGFAVGLDASEGMVRALQARRGDAHLATACGRAGALPFASASFDAVTSRFGVMFFPDPGAALREIARVLRPGGRATLIVWGSPDANPYFRYAGDALDAVGCPPAEIPEGMPTVFEFGESGRLAAIQREAGFQEVTEERLPMLMRLPGIQPDELLDVQLSISPNLKDRCVGLDPEQLDAARRHVGQAVAEHNGSEGLQIPGEVLLVSGSLSASR